MYLKILIKYLLNLFPRPLLIKISFFVRPFISLFYRGIKFTDPIDGKSFRKFLPYGYEKLRQNALSPSTFSLERHRLLWLYLSNETNFFTSQKKVLHIAPEQCFYKLFKKQRNLNYTTADLNSPIADVKADICDLPFPENSFDVVFCNHVLEHVEDDKKAIQELFRVLKKDGFGIFQVPIDMNLEQTFEDSSIKSKKERKEHFGQYDHVRIYGKDYFLRLKNAGFKINKFDYSKRNGDDLLRKYSLIKGEILPVCYK